MSALDEFDRFDDLRREIAALPDIAPYATWAKWFLSTDPARSIAPGFTIRPADAEKLAQEMAAGGNCDIPTRRARARAETLSAPLKNAQLSTINAQRSTLK